MPIRYRVHIKEHLDHAWAEWFENMTITYTSDDQTILEGPLVDTAALYGLISKVRDLGLTLTALQPLGEESSAS